VPISIGGGATSSTATGDNTMQTGIPIGFNFGYGDSTFSSISLNTNGLVWFDVLVPNPAMGHFATATTTAPNQTLWAWANDDLIDDASSDILYQLQGTPGSQTFTIQYTNYPTGTGVAGSNVRMNCQIILYETSNIIEFRYGSLNIIGPQTNTGAGIGIEYGLGGIGNYIDAITGSSSVTHKMLSPLNGWPTYNFRFSPGIPSTITAGTYNVGVGQTYNSLTEAVADVNHRGITGVVTLNLTDAQYDTTAANGSNIFPIFVATPNSDSINKLTISKTGTPATLAYRGSSINSTPVMAFGTGVGISSILATEEPILGVCGSYTTISNINLITHGLPQVVDVGLLQFDMFYDRGAQHNLYDKISVNLDRTHGNALGMYSKKTTSQGGIPGTNSMNTWRDISIKDCNYGFRILTGPNTGEGGNQLITSSCNTFNYIGDPNTPDDILSSSNNYGVWIQGQWGFTMRNCIVQNVTTTSPTAIQGVLIQGAVTGVFEISNNIIRNIKRINSQVYPNNPIDGINIDWGNHNISFRIFNNSISNLLTTYAGAPTDIVATRGFAFDDGGAGTVSVDLFNNSVSIDGSTFPNASNLCVDVFSLYATFNFKNNVFANFTTGQTGIANHTCFYSTYANQYGDAASNSDYNNYYIADTANGAPFKAATTMYSTLAAWQAAMAIHPNSEANSQFANPHFLNNATDLHATTASTTLDETGTTIPSYITTDIDCETRVAPHDIGFDDFSTVMFTYYADSDNDTYGDSNDSTQTVSPTPPAGYVVNNTDCDDNNSSVHPGAAELCNGIDDDCNGQIDDNIVFSTYYADADGDGFGDPAVDSSACAPPVGYVSNNSDCNDANNAIYPGATEVCNGIDDNCDGQIDEGVLSTFYADTDGDGFGDAAVTTQACSAPIGYVSNNTDCDDNNNTIYPGATEICGNSIDDDCDGQVDEGCGNNTWYADADADTYGDINNFIVDNNPTPPAGYVADSTDCNDANAAINPGATEICGNGIDDNCNGQIDENSPSAADAGADIAVCSANNTILGATAPIIGSGSWSIVSGVGGSIAQPNNPNSAFSGQYNKPYVLEWTTSNGGCVFTDQVSVLFVNTNYSPGRIAGFSGQTSAVCGLTQTYAAIPNHPYATYAWSGYPAGTTVNSQSGNQITLTYPNGGFNYFQLKVTSTICGIQTPIRSVAMKGAPSTKTATGPSIVCANTTGVIYSVDSLDGVTYNWSVPQGATIVSGQGTHQITVDWGTTSGLVLCNIWNSCGSSTAKKSVTTNCRSAQESLTQNNQVQLNIFPNPSSGIFEITTPVDLKNASIEVTDMQGRVLVKMAINNSENQIDLSSYSQGVYLLVLHSETDVQTYKLIKQ
jgi:hypothetical protein